MDIKSRIYLLHNILFPTRNGRKKRFNFLSPKYAKGLDRAARLWISIWFASKCMFIFVFPYSVQMLFNLYFARVRGIGAGTIVPLSGTYFSLSAGSFCMLLLFKETHYYYDAHTTFSRFQRKWERKIKWEENEGSTCKDTYNCNSKI